MSAIFGKKHPYTSAVIVAAGLGTRFSEVRTKQNIPVNAVPVVVRTLKAFEASSLIDEIILVGRAEELALFNEYVMKYNMTKVKAVVEAVKQGRNPRSRVSMQCGKRRNMSL